MKQKGEQCIATIFRNRAWQTLRKWGALVTLQWIITGCLCTEPLHGAVEFVQLTDPHVFDKRPGEDVENKAAFADCIAQINQLHAQLLKANGTGFRFVVLTGDIGIEELGRTNQPSLRAGIDEVAQTIGKSDIKDWLFVPGNNDLTKERPGTIDRYHAFVKGLKARLRRGGRVSVTDLCPKNTSQTNSRSATYLIPGLGGKFHMIGFDNASFKSDDTNALAFYEAHLDRIGQVEQTLKSVKEGEFAYVFYHIPEIDDPHKVSLATASELDQRHRQKMAAGDPFLYSAWNVANDVREAWNKVVANPKVKGLFAGHFHSSVREHYRDLKTWTVTSVSTGAVHNAYLAVENGKLFVCPPIACKYQTGSKTQARGFRTYTIDESDGTARSEIVWH